MPKLKEYFTGKKGKVKQHATVTPGQQELLGLIEEGLKEGKGPLADIFGGFDKEAFEEGVSKPALANFEENILPVLMEKFIAGGAYGGSSMRNAGLKEASKLQTELSKLMYQAQQDALKNKISGLQTSLGTKAVENVYHPGMKGAIQGFVEGAAPEVGKSAGKAVSNLFTGAGNLGEGGGAGNASDAAKIATMVG